jgi:PPOX class probable F420-dependent enzyme
VGAKTLDELPGWAKDLVEAGRVARLGLLDFDDRPRVLPVTYVLLDGAIWSAVDRKPKRAGEPARVRYLRRRPEAALTVDHYSDDWRELAWVQVLGSVKLLEPSQAKPAIAALAAKYEPYRDEPPPGPLLRLVPDRLMWWAAKDSPL